MKNEQQAFWQVIVVHIVVATFVALNALPYLREVPFWFVVLAIALGAAGGMLRAAQASVVHRVHRPNVLRGIAESLLFALVLYAAVRQLSELSPTLTSTALVGVMAALPVWLVAYAAYMLVNSPGAGRREPSRNG
jgi:hypothetical protein